MNGFLHARRLLSGQAGARRWLLLILLGYLLVASSYALATPPLESSDEFKHYPLVQYVQTHGELPILEVEDPGRWLQEAAQPPLYYLLMAALTAGIDTGDLPQIHHLNPHAFIGNPNQVGNKNLIIHDPAQERFPWQGSVLAIYLIRFASILLGVGTILVVARLGTLLFTPEVGLLAAAFTAFNPMFLFVSAAVNNDSLAILLGHAGLYALVLLWRERPDPQAHPWAYARLGLVLGLGLLTKLSLGGLLGIAGLCLAWIAWRRGQWRFLFLGGGIVLITALLPALPWFARNLRLYGDPTALNIFIAVQGTRETAMTWRDWVGEFGTFYRSFWGLFGGVNVAAPEIFYVVANLVAVLATAGFGGWLWQRRRTPTRLPAGWWLLLIWPLILFNLLVRWTIISQAFQGRLIFPGLGALNVAGVVGLCWLARRLRARRLVPALALLAFVAAALLPWLTIRPAYAYPEPIAAVPEEATFGPITFQAPEGEIRLVGVEMPPGQSVVPGGGPVEVTLYWQAVTPLTADYLSTVHLLGRRLESVGSVNRHPAGGMVPTSRWQPGQIWKDVYHLYPAQDAEAPVRMQVRVGLYDPETESDLPMQSVDGSPLSLLVVGDARLGARDADTSPPPVPLDLALADGLTLRGYALAPQPARPGDTVRLTLSWQAEGTPTADYTVFVHLLDEASQQVLVADGPPLDGEYPTSFWRAGDIVRDLHTFTLPADLAPGDYRIALGLYDPATGQRLALRDGGDGTVYFSFPVPAAADPATSSHND